MSFVIQYLKSFYNLVLVAKYWYTYTARQAYNYSNFIKQYVSCCLFFDMLYSNIIIDD